MYILLPKRILGEKRYKPFHGKGNYRQNWRVGGPEREKEGVVVCNQSK